LSFGGESDRSIATLEDAKRLSPRDYLMVIWHACDAWSHLHAERFVEAIACAKQAIEFNPAFPDSHGIHAAAAAYLGQMTEARAGLAEFVRLLPGLTLSDARLIRPFRRPTDRERFLAGLGKAGLAE
jgi:tetratricopeptide (TPR) repeat protein